MKQSKIKQIESRLTQLEKHTNIKPSLKRPHPKGTENPLFNSMGALVFGWLILLVAILLCFWRYLRILFFMSRMDQYMNKKKAYIKGKFNFLQYIYGGD